METNFETTFVNKLIEQIQSKVNAILEQRIWQFDPYFDSEQEAKKRFKRVCQEVRGEIHSYYWNDGSERGIHLFSYKIVHPEWNINEPIGTTKFTELVGVNDPSI